MTGEPSQRVHGIPDQRQDGGSQALYGELEAGYGSVVRASFYYRVLEEVELETLAGLVERLPEGARVLDVGCGDGRYSCLLSHRRLSVTALDPVPAMRRATRRAAQRQGAAVDVLGGSLGALPVADQRFQAVVCVGSVLNHATDPERGLSELCRVLAPGGWLLLDLDNPRAYRAQGTAKGAGPGQAQVWTWPFQVDGREQDLTLTLLPPHRVYQVLRGHGLELVGRRGVHLTTRFWDLTTRSAMLADQSDPSPGLRLARVLDRGLGAVPGVREQAGTLIVVAHKPPAAADAAGGPSARGTES